MIYVKDIIEKCDGKLIYGNLNLECNSFSKDTRTLKKGDIYIGIKGEKFDGNDFYQEAVKYTYNFEDGKITGLSS